MRSQEFYFIIGPKYMCFFASYSVLFSTYLLYAFMVQARCVEIEPQTKIVKKESFASFLTLINFILLIFAPKFVLVKCVFFYNRKMRLYQR